ncbi:hypothetical protein BH11VER1_BH11VER1_16080 [soil metagenome]
MFERRPIQRNRDEWIIHDANAKMDAKTRPKSELVEMHKLRETVERPNEKGWLRVKKTTRTQFLANSAHNLTTEFLLFVFLHG